MRMRTAIERKISNRSAKILNSLRLLEPRTDQITKLIGLAGAINYQSYQREREINTEKLMQHLDSLESQFRDL